MRAGKLVHQKSYIDGGAENYARGLKLRGMVECGLLGVQKDEVEDGKEEFVG